MKGYDENKHVLISGGYMAKPQIETVRQLKIVEIKKQAGERIGALNWQHERAERHQVLGKAPKKASADVYLQQQLIEEASDQAELDVYALNTIEEINSFTW